MNKCFSDLHATSNALASGIISKLPDLFDCVATYDQKNFGVADQSDSRENVYIVVFITLGTSARLYYDVTVKLKCMFPLTMLLVLL